MTEHDETKVGDELRRGAQSEQEVADERQNALDPDELDPGLLEEHLRQAGEIDEEEDAIGAAHV